MSLKKLVIILLGGLLVGCVVLQFVGAPSKNAAVGQTDQTSGRPVLESEEARQKLAEVLDGKRKPPELGSEAWGRYYTLTRKWIGSLSFSDCIALIDLTESNRSRDLMRQELYERLGELDPHGAILRISKCPDDDGKKNYLTTSMLQGWGRIQPEEAWAYLMGFNEEDGRSKLTDGGVPEFAAEVIMGAWANKDATSAYARLLKAPRELFMKASCGYYYGLSNSVNFEFESRQLEALLDSASRSPSPLFGWSSVNDPPQHRLPIALGTKWANHDPEAAISWWLKIDKDSEGWKDKEKWKAYRTARFVEEWVGRYVKLSPDQAIRWVDSHPELLQKSHFQELALPALARWLPEQTIDLIRRIEPSRLQAFQLQRLTRPPVYSGVDHYRRQEPSAILLPDLVEGSLEKFTFTDEERKTVTDAIKDRRQHEAKQPVFPSSGW
ncbi:MAG: hypothetical protein CFE26_02950 [Verrucomicrobiales bacterium VVV1]|nr:MAG: hypothetical protein CFE26_02950 [Verrucomicrobiales bacterium VVV1]